MNKNTQHNPNLHPEQANTVESELSTSELIEIRRRKLANLREQGIAYPIGFKRDALAASLRAQYENQDEDSLLQQAITATVAGRIMTRRIMGKAAFVHIQDMSGRMQLYIRQDIVGDDVYAQFKDWDLGDIIGAKGVLFKTKTGELSLKINDIQLLTKSIKPLPDKFHGLKDQETCYRQRYLDLMVNPETRATFMLRTQIIDHVRQFLRAKQFIEVETPMMQSLAGGAIAKPFVTHHHALNMPLYLRVAPELYLKRLVVGGLERVFEINRNFRNEGLSTRHNPEFTMVEFYQAYAEYTDLMQLTEEMLREITQVTKNSLQLNYQAQAIDFSQPFQRLTLFDAILQFNPHINSAQLSDFTQACKLAKDMDINLDKSAGLGKVQVEIFEKTVEHQLIQPTFITHYPAETSPLARRNDENPFYTDRFELFIAGREIANGFNELNDPDDQAERFQQQMHSKAAGDEEAMPYDEDYITALQYGMPPTAGEGIGIDRLVMLYTDAASIRDVILFPHMRAKEKEL